MDSTVERREAQRVAADKFQLKCMIQRGESREEIRRLLGWSDVTLRDQLRQLKREMGAAYVRPSIRKRRPEKVQATSDISLAREQKRLDAIDRQLARAKPCPRCHLRMFSGRCDYCVATAERSAGLGQSLAGYCEVH
jgi:hypothetical protein